MIYAELYLTNPATGSKSLLTSTSGLTFDLQADFRPSTLGFTVTKDEAVEKDIRSGKYFSIVVDSQELDTRFVLEGDGLDFVTEEGVISSTFSGRSLHCMGEDTVVFPSAWPNPTPSGHAFQNSTPGTMILTLVSRSKERGMISAWTTASFNGTHDSNGVTWPAMADRNFSNGDTLLQVFQGLIDDGLVELDVVGFDLRAYVPGTLGVHRSQDAVLLRPGYSLSEGSTERDATDMATDVFAIGDGDAVASKTRPALYDVVGRRREKFIQYGGIADANILGLLADAQLDQSGHVKQEDTVKVPHVIYQPFVDYKLNDWVNLDRGTGAVEEVQIKQISISQSQEDYEVSISLGDLLDTLDQKLTRRIDAITGANAGGGSVPSDKTDDKLAPASPASIGVTSIGYIDQNGNRKVAALADWPDVSTNSNGTPADDIDHYEYQYRTSTSAPVGSPTALTPGRPNINLNTLFDRRSKPFGWVGGDGVAATRNTVTNKDYWAFGDSGIGVLDAEGKYAAGTDGTMVHNSIVVTNPAVTNSFQSIYGKPNMLPKPVVLGKFLGIALPTNCAVTISPEWDGFGGVGYKMVTTATSPASTLIGQNFFGDNGSKPMVGGKQYTVKVRLRKASSAATARIVKIGIQTFDSTNTALSPVTVDVQESALSDYDATVLVTAPANAVKGNPFWQVVGAANGEVHGSARWGFYEGDARAQTWSANDNTAADSLVTPHSLDGDVSYTTALWQTDLLRNTLSATGSERRVGFIGDCEGVGVSAWSNRMQTTLQTLARGRFASVSGKVQKSIGYIPGSWSSSSIPAATTLAGGAAFLDVTGGLGLRTTKVPVGGTVTYPPMMCDAIDVYYTQNDFFPGTFTVKVDGKVLKTIDTTGPAGSGLAPKHVRVQMPRTLVTTTHTVVITGVTSDSYFNGIEFRDSQTDGLYIVDSAHSGFPSSYFADASAPSTQLWAALRDANVTHLVVMLGASDMGLSTPAQWGTKVTNFISRAQSELKPGGWPVAVTFLHWGKLPGQPASGGANPQDLSLYEAAAVDAASRFINTEVVLLSRFWPDGSYSWSADGINPNDIGADFFARQILLRTWDQLTSNFIWFGSIWSAASKFFVTGMQIGSTPILRTNLVTNPTFGTASGTTAGYVLQSASATAAPATDWAANGKGFSLKLSRTSDGTGDAYASIGGDAGGIRSGMVPGKTYTVSATSNIKTAFVGATAGTWQRKSTISVFVRNVSGSGYTEYNAALRPATGEFFHTITFTVPITATEAFIRLSVGSQSAADAIYWDNVILEERSTLHVASDYFDGNTNMASSGSTGVRWDGAVDASVSRQIGSTAVVPQTTRVMQYDAATVALERVDSFGSPDLDVLKQWTTAAWTEDANYAYIFGKNAANQPVLARAPLANPFMVSNIKVWNGSTWSGPTNIALDPSFEAQTRVLTAPFSYTSTAPHSGTTCIQADAGPDRNARNFAAIVGTVAVNPGDVLKYSFWQKTTTDWDGTTNNSKMRLANQAGTFLAQLNSVQSYGQWTQVSGQFTVPASGTTALAVTMVMDHIVGKIWYDDFDFTIIPAAGAPTYNALPINTDPYTFDSLRKVGGTYSAYFMIGFNPNIYRKTSTSLTGPWTTDATVVYKTPESGGNVMTYIPRMYPQLDSAQGTVYGYSTNLISSNWGDPVSGPRFALGPQAGLAPTDISTQEYGSILTTAESKAFASNFEANTAIQFRARTVDSGGLVSTPWTESVASVLVGTAGDTLVAPSKPSVSPDFQGLTIVWDGLDTNGNRPTNEWAGVQVHVSPDGEFFQPTGLTQKGIMPIYGIDGGPNVYPVQGLDPGKAYWVKLVAIGKPPNGGVSQPSAPEYAVTARLISDDLTPKLIDEAALGDGAVHAANLSVATFSDQLVPNADFEDGFENNLPKTWSLLNRYIGNGDVAPVELTGGAAIGGSSSLGLTITPGNGRVIMSQITALVPGDIYYFAAMVQTSRVLATANSFTIAMLYSTDSSPDSFANYGISAQAGLQLPMTAFTGAVDAPVKLEGQLKVPDGMTYGCFAIIAMPDTGASTNVDVTIDDTQFKRVVGTANIANLAVNNAKIADLAVDDAKISNVKAGKITTDILTANLTLSGRIMTASAGQRVELNTNGLAAYNASDLLPVTQVTTDGGLTSKWFRTNTSGTRIEAGTYAAGGGSAMFAFFPDSATWQFPPAVGYGGAYTSNWIPGVAMYSGSLSSTNYGKYGLSQMGLDQVGGIGLITGKKLDGTEGTIGADIRIDAGGTSGSVYITGGGSSTASLTLDSDASGSSASKLVLPYGHLSFNAGGTDSNGMFRSAVTWSGFPADHLVLGAGGGLRITTYNNTSLAVGITTNGGLIGNGAWGTVKLIARDGASYMSLGADGTVWKDANTSSTKTFVIQHPVEEDKYLVHATVEMPENRVAYEGNSKLEPAPEVLSPGSPNMKDNFIGSNDKEIVLPDYFTALVDESTAVVTVSAYYHDCEDSCEYHGTPSIAATKVKDGKFRVKATGGYYHPDISFAWHVSAVRKDVPALEVEPNKADVTMHGDGPYTYITSN